MRTILDVGTVERSDKSENRWIGKWIAWEDKIDRKEEVEYDGEIRTCSTTSAQNFSEGRLQVASMLFDQLLTEFGHYPE